MIRIGYAKLLAEDLLLELCLMMKLAPDFVDFSGTSNGNC